IREAPLDLALAQRFQAAVALAGHLLDRLVGQLCQRRVFPHPWLRDGGVDRDGRDEEVPPAVGEGLGRRGDDAWYVAAGVDHAVPGAALEDCEAAVAIAVQLLELWIQLGRVDTAVEERHLVSPLERRVDD